MLPPHLVLDPARMHGEMIVEPNREDVDISVNERMVIEYYARRNVRA